MFSMDLAHAGQLTAGQSFSAQRGIDGRLGSFAVHGTASAFRR